MTALAAPHRWALRPGGPPAPHPPSPVVRAADALRTLARTAAPAGPAGVPRPSPLAEALHGLGALAPAPGGSRYPSWPARPHTPGGAGGGPAGPSSQGSPTGRGPADPRLTALSPAERRVAVLAADGCCNREIARRLFITVSTVEQHLTKTYRKLGVHSRGELPSAAGRGDAPR